MTFVDDIIIVTLDGQELAPAQDGTLTHGMVGLATGWNTACFDRLRIAPV
jgi:hypothetical protein